MPDIEIKWITNEEGKKFIVSDIVNSKIEINEENKEIQNAKAFFREIIYQSFLHEWNRKIILVDDPANEINEVKPILKELIEICNDEIGAQY